MITTTGIFITTEMVFGYCCFSNKNVDIKFSVHNAFL